jgi:AP-3 complex subunit sigma
MIHAVLIFNTSGKPSAPSALFVAHVADCPGKPRLSKFYTSLPPLVQQSLISQIFSLISDRPSGVCNFLDAPDLVFPTPASAVATASYSGNGKGKETVTGVRGDDDTRVIYRHYATLYFV